MSPSGAFVVAWNSCVNWKSAIVPSLLVTQKHQCPSRDCGMHGCFFHFTFKAAFTILERPEFELAPKTCRPGSGQENGSYNTECPFYTHLYESLVISTQPLCSAVNSASHFDALHHDWPVINLASPNPQRLSEVGCAFRCRCTK